MAVSSQRQLLKISGCLVFSDKLSGVEPVVSSLSALHESSSRRVKVNTGVEFRVVW